MGLVTLTEILKESVEKKYAVGAFDTLDDNFTEAIVAAAEEEGLPVILMVPNFFADDRDGRHDDRYRPARNGRLAATGISAKPVLHTDKPSGKEYRDEANRFCGD